MEQPYLSFNQTNDLVTRLPTFELSYETISHKKVSEYYDITLAIPYGRKSLIWYTFYKNKDVCILLEFGKIKKITNAKIISNVNIPREMAYGTILYGCLCEIPETRTIFIIEDLLYYKGISTFKQPFQERFNFLHDLFSNNETLFNKNVEFPICLPVFWKILPDHNNIPDEYKNIIPYSIHHLQHRSNDRIVPYVNFPWSKTLMPSLSKNIPVIPDKLLFIPPQLPRFNFTKPQYKSKTIFEIKADLQYDIYHLYAFGKGSERIYCGIAYIPNYPTSKMMNTLFRNIKENKNLDYLEESDDEEDFQDLSVDKYVDLNKKFSIECIYKSKFKRWVPIRQVHGHGQIVHIRQL